MEYTLKCLNCGNEYKSSYKSQVCDKCGGILEVVYKGKIGKEVARAKSFWDMEGALPDGKYRHFDVGMTKLLPSNDDNDVLFKLEFENPTHSFKDRGSVVEVAKAREYGYEKIACASTGNMAYSISYYAKLYGIEAAVFISKSANRDKLVDIKSTHDAELHLINGDFTRAQRDAEAYAKREGAFLAGDYCYRKEGQSTIAYELLAQAKDLANIVIPIGNATLFSAMFKAYSRMRESGMIGRMPKLIGVEAAGCAPVYKALKQGGGVVYERPKTFADAIAVGMPTYGMQAVEAVAKTGGDIVLATDDEMRREQERFYDEYGVVIELASAASIAAYKKIKGRLRGKTALLITGANV